MNAKQPVEYSDFSLVSYPSDAYNRIEAELRRLYRLCEPDEPEDFAPLLAPSWLVVGYSKGRIASFLVVSDTLEIQKQEPEDFEQKGGIPNERGWFITSVCGDNTHYYGLLEELFATLKSYAVARHYAYLLLHVSSTRPWLPAKYERQGFRRGKTFTENNEAFVIMHMMLTGKQFVWRDDPSIGILDVEKLWELTRNRTSIQVNVVAMDPLLDADIWSLQEGREVREGEEERYITPRQLLRNPRISPEHWAKVLKANMKYPILVLWPRNAAQPVDILDGFHRLTKAVFEKRKVIQVIPVTQAEMDLARISKEYSAAVSIAIERNTIKIYDVCMVYDLACAHCGNTDAAQLDKSLGLVFCNTECREASLCEEPRDEPILTDVSQLFWNHSKHSHVLVFTQASLKKKIKKKAKKAKKKLKKGKKKVKKKLKKPKKKLKKGPGKPSRPGTPGRPARPGAPGRPEGRAEQQPEDIVEQQFSLQYLLKKHGIEMSKLDAMELYELRPELETGSFGTYLVNFAITALSSRQNYPRLAAQVRPQLLESATELEYSARS